MVVSENERIVKERNEPFGVERELLDRIFDSMKRYDNVENKKARIVKKATRILAGITFAQPFMEGNKETALYLTMQFLNANGYDLNVESIDLQLKLYDLSVKTVFKFHHDETVYSEVENFLMQNVITVQ